jgi:hypothetical protein
MAHKASRRGAVDLGMPLMILAFIAMGGFLYWLFAQAATQKAKEDVQLQQAEAAKANSYPDAKALSGTELQVDPAPFVGQLVKLAAMPVASALGQQGFWLELPNKNPFLVSLDDSLKADVKASSGQKVMTVGTILPMSDSVLDAWTKSGSIGEGDKLAAEFATHYLQARHVEVTPAGGGGGQG